MYSLEHKKYLRRKRNKRILITSSRLLLAILLIVIWEVLARYKIINTFITSSPSNVVNTIVSLYNDNQVLLFLLK